MSKYFIDASVWIAFIVEADSLHQKAQHLLKKTLNSNTQILTSDYVLDETLTRIKRKKDGQASKEFLSGIFDQKTQVIFTSKILFKKTITFFNKHPQSKSFSFTDASILATMKHHKIKNLLTFDRDLQSIAKKHKITTIC